MLRNIEQQIQNIYCFLLLDNLKDFILGFGSWISNSKLDKQSGKRFYSFLKDTGISISRL